MGLLDILSEGSKQFSGWLGEGAEGSQFEPQNPFTKMFHRIARAMPTEAETQPTTGLTTEGLLSAGDVSALPQEEAIRRGLVKPTGNVAPLSATAAWASGGNPSGVPGPRFGTVTTGPSDVNNIMNALDQMDKVVPGVKELMLRSNYNFGMRPRILMDEVKKTYSNYPERWGKIGGWNQAEFDSASGALLGSKFNSVEGHYNRPEARTLLARHEYGHGFPEVLGGNRTEGIPGVELTDYGKQYLTDNLYSPDRWPAEIPAILFEGDFNKVQITDPIAFEKWRQEKILKHPDLINKPLFVVDPAVDLEKGPMRTLSDQDKFTLGQIRENDLNKNEYSLKNQLKHRQTQLINAEKRKFAKQGNVVEPIASDDMDKAFNYALKQYTPLHTDNPILKEAKNKRLQSFMDWWERSDDTARRDFVKSLPQEAAPVQPKSEPYRPQPSGEPFSEEAILSERDRLKKIHTRLRSQSGKLRGVR